MDKLKFLFNCTEDALSDYWEAIDGRVAELWEAEFGDDSWLEFRQLLDKIKVEVSVDGDSK